MFKKRIMCFGVLVGGLQVGCSQPTSAEVKVPLGEAAFEAESVAPRKQYIEAFADKNENGKFDGTDTKLYWVGTTLSSPHSIVIPKYKKTSILVLSSALIESDKDITIERSLLCGSKSTST